MLDIDKVHCGDCLELLKELQDKSVDLVLTDMPYNITACSWDQKAIDLGALWLQLKRIGKDNCAYVFTASQPFTTDLINSNREWFKYEWIWEKTHYQGFMNALLKPLKAHENILVFYNSRPAYNPVMRQGDPYIKKHVGGGSARNYGIGTDRRLGKVDINYGTRFPKDILLFNNGNYESQHPTQKPVALMEYLIKTYTNEGDLVCDPFLGSGTTAVACVNTKRNFIGIELDEHYAEVARERVYQSSRQLIMSI